ncbi:putative AAA+ superfamily ATPase [Lactobacillus colini]|uniref:AAA+ superfamily ATPase n=1 Tax=Lactobacillus colini TaxID=1819254 RepID=A0ABS4MF32_9LACO|nr:ATP-binding protein [Lactobacillus colini]MBP2058296.1 putative AAA+ superfamily ATPase [Lactobacillus colini]
MESALLKSIIFSQHEIIRNEEIVPRDYQFAPNDNYVLVGMRRAGKTMILHEIVQKLIKNGVDWSQIIYINFEDERLQQMTINEFNDIVVVANELSDEKSYFFFDEIQNIDGWESFARRMADDHQRVYITGSNSKMMSSEIIGKLGGRYMMKLITPYNLKEFLTAKNIQHDEAALYTNSLLAKIKAATDDYLHNGGLPERLTQLDVRDYLTNIYQNIYLGDIIRRNSVRNKKSLSLLITKIAQTVMHEISYNGLVKAVKSTGNTISVPSAMDYVDFAREAFLLFDIKNFAAKFSERESLPKFYFQDNGILNLFLFQKDSILLENIVAIALYNRFSEDLYYLHSKKTGIDIDFYLPNKHTAIQVSWMVDEFSSERELGNLIKLAKNDSNIQKLYIITMEQEQTITQNDVRIELVSLYKFLLKMAW